MKEHFSSRVAKLLVILALAIVASVMFVIVGCSGNEDTTPHQHTWTSDSSRTDTEATCTVDGVHYLICSECGMTTNEVIPATGHTWANDGALLEQAATCTENGYYYRLCEDCGYRETSSVILATGHKLDLDNVTVTAPTCTADGSISGTCANGCGETVTLTADQIVVSGTNANVSNYDETELKAKAAAAKEEWFNANDQFLQTLGHDYHYNNTYSCVTVANDKTIPGATSTTGNPTEYYWNYCDRCETAFEVEAHSVPNGYNPCEVAMNPNTNQPLRTPADYVAPTGSNEYAGADAEYAYQCSECDNYIAQTDHSYQLMSLVSGTPNSQNDPAVWEAAPADAQFSCLYYEVCEWCGYSRISRPHTPSATAPTCTEAVTCEVCGALVEAALGHNITMGGGFGNITTSGTVAATCTTGTITYMHCSRCDAREKQGETIEWVLGENYTMTEGNDALGHTYGQQVVYDTSVDAVGCARPFWYQDVCTRCKDDVSGHVRVAVKPTVYTRSGTEGNYTYTAVTGALQAGGTYFVNNGGNYVAFTDITNYNNNQYNDNGTVRYYTDENGYYNRQPGGQHNWGTFLTKTEDGELIDYENNSQLTQFVMPTCSTDGVVLYRCSNPGCGEYAWMSVDLETYTNAMNAAAAGTSKASQYPAYATAITMQKYHDATMYTCGHSECAECKTMEHNVQYSVSFVVNLDKTYTGITAPTIDTFYGWTCWIDEVEKENLTNFINGYTTDTDEAEFTYEFFSDAAMQTAMDWAPVGEPVGNNAYSQFITVYVKATPKVDYTIDFNTDGLIDALKNNAAFADRTVYMAQADKSQAAPVVAGYTVRYYTDADHTTIFDFASFDWDNVAGDTVTIYVA